VAFQNASCPCDSDARCAARPEYDSRIVNSAVLVLIPRKITHRSWKSTSASAAGRCVCGTQPSSNDLPASAVICGRRLRTWSRTVEYDRSVRAVLVHQSRQNPSRGVTLLLRRV
jgi:hypothetical protein